jgi:hypothetical protein
VSLLRKTVSYTLNKPLPSALIFLEKDQICLSYYQESLSGLELVGGRGSITIARA